MSIAELYETNYIDLLSLSPWEFDQSLRGWRGIDDHRQQAATILGYINKWAAGNKWKSNAPKGGKDISPNLLIFHVGQIYATLGNTPRAVKFLGFACNTTYEQWNNYVQATMAFLQKDRAAFQRYAAPPNYNADTMIRLKQS